MEEYFYNTAVCSSVMSCSKTLNSFVFQVCPEGGGDKSAGCEQWKKSGFCSPTNMYYQFMTEMCPASCELCQGLSEKETLTVLYSFSTALRSLLCIHSHDSFACLCVCLYIFDLLGCSPSFA